MDRSRREAQLASVYDFRGLGSVEGITRLVEIAALEALQLDNSIERIRLLAYLAQVARKLLQAGEMDERLQAIEAAISQRPIKLTRRNNKL